MAHLVVAYPELSVQDFKLIQEFRRKNDEAQWKIVDPHFTLVFPISNHSREEFLVEIPNKSANLVRFDFKIRCATINKDAFKECYYIFLVPDEGHSQFIKIHDRLYSGIFRDNLRLETDYVPHITIGSSADKFHIKQLVYDWNGRDFLVKGMITKLTVITYEENMA